MQLFYTPQHARVGDVIPYYEDGKFHRFLSGKTGIHISAATGKTAGIC